PSREEGNGDELGIQPLGQRHRTAQPPRFARWCTPTRLATSRNRARLAAKKQVNPTFEPPRAKWSAIGQPLSGTKETWWPFRPICLWPEALNAKGSRRAGRMPVQIPNYSSSSRFAIFALKTRLF